MSPPHTRKSGSSTLIDLPDGIVQVIDHDTGQSWVGRESGACILGVLPNGAEMTHDTVPGKSWVGHRPPPLLPAPPPVKSVTAQVRLPAELAERLERAGEQHGGKSHVLRALIERGLQDFEAADALKIPTPEGRERFVTRRLERHAERAATQRKPGK